MKRTLSVLLAALMVFAVVGQASAYFEKGNLVQVIYKDSDHEVLTDVLNTTTFDFSSGTQNLTAAGTFATTQFAALGTYQPSDWGQLNAAFFAYFTGSGKGEAWFATTQNTAPTISGASLGAFIGGATAIQGGLNPVGTQTVQWDYANNQKAYDYVFNSKSADTGSFAGYNTSAAVGELSLAGLATQDYVSMYLYKYNLSTLVPNTAAGTPYMGELRLYADGHTSLNVAGGAPVPIPPAVLLLGTGILGLVGIRRRKIN